ncbi:hypothetical protein LINPERPRIM_LOCUS5928 [Linum perenne]
MQERRVEITKIEEPFVRRNATRSSKSMKKEVIGAAFVEIEIGGGRKRNAMNVGLRKGRWDGGLRSGKETKLGERKSRAL